MKNWNRPEIMELNVAETACGPQWGWDPCKPGKPGQNPWDPCKPGKPGQNPWDPCKPGKPSQNPWNPCNPGGGCGEDDLS